VAYLRCCDLGKLPQPGRTAKTSAEIARLFRKDYCRPKKDQRGASILSEVSQAGARLILEKDEKLPNRFVLLLSTNGGVRAALSR
jgi:hypothetical protein